MFLKVIYSKDGMTEYSCGEKISSRDNGDVGDHPGV